jgi:hypothetical protein
MSDQSNINRDPKAGDIPGLDIKPVFSNKSNVALNGITTRIVFGEYVAGDPIIEGRYHTSVSLPTADALNLANLILRLFAENQKAQEMQKVIQDELAKASSGSIPKQGA